MFSGVALRNGRAQIAFETPILGVTNGRQLASWLGLVPKQHATGGKPTWLGISKRGNSSVRKRLIHGALAVVRHRKGNTDAGSRWLQGVEHRRGTNRACGAPANTVAWGLVASERGNVSASIGPREVSRGKRSREGTRGRVMEGEQRRGKTSDHVLRKIRGEINGRAVPAQRWRGEVDRAGTTGPPGSSRP